MSQCELCTQRHPQEIWRNAHFYILQANEPLVPGFVRVVCTEHIAEMSDLPNELRVELWEILNTVESVMRETMQPTKVNLAQFGNMVPHLHWHVIPRYSDDAYFPGSVWSPIVRETPDSTLEARRELAKRFVTTLVEKLG